MPTHLWQGQGGGRREQGQGIPTPTTCRGAMWYRAAATPRGKQRSSNPGHQAQCSGTNSGYLHTDGDETPAQRSGCGHLGVPQHLWVQPSSLCTAQRGKAKGQLGVKSSPWSAPQALPWRKRQTMCLPVWPRAHRWRLPQRGTYLEIIHSEGMPF